MEHIPDSRITLAFVVVPGAAPGTRMGIVRFNESGYYASDYDVYESGAAGEAKCREHAHLINESRGIPDEVAYAMLCGSMYGWTIPAAKAARDFYAGVAA